MRKPAALLITYLQGRDWEAARHLAPCQSRNNATSLRVLEAIRIADRDHPIADARLVIGKLFCFSQPVRSGGWVIRRRNGRRITLRYSLR
jgi:hypothetical protein